MTAVTRLTLAGLALIALSASVAVAPASAAKSKRLSVAKAKRSIQASWRKGYDEGTWRLSCARSSKRKVSCYLIRTAGVGPDCGLGEARLTKKGKTKASAWGYECASIPRRRWPKGVAVPTPTGREAVPAPGSPAGGAAPVAPPTPAGPVAGGLSGTFVCLTGIIAQVRPAGPTTIAPINVPATGIEPPLKFTLNPDGTYANITFGAAYANNPQWRGTYTVQGEQVRLVTPNGTLMTSYPFLRRTDTGGTQYLLEDAPANDQYRANVCRRIA